MLTYSSDEDSREKKRRKLELSAHHNRSSRNSSYANVAVNLPMLITYTYRSNKIANSLFEILVKVICCGYRQKFYSSSRHYTWGSKNSRLVVKEVTFSCTGKRDCCIYIVLFAVDLNYNGLTFATWGRPKSKG